MFETLDPHLRQLKKLPHRHRPKLLARLCRLSSGIYTLSGGRQVGKTTLMKQWMAELLAKRVPPKSIVYVTGEVVDDHHSLIRILSEVLGERPAKGLHHVIVDEVTYIREWDKGIKYLADSGFLENTVLLITGSDLGIIAESRMRFPGRRGTTGMVDFTLYPLSFRDCVELQSILTDEEINMVLDPKNKGRSDPTRRLFTAFENYLIHGGFLTALNDMAVHGKILPSTFSTYSDWIRGDMLKRHKQERYLREILAAIIKRYGSQITWNNLAQDLSIDHPHTVADYIDLLAAMDAVFVQYPLQEDKLGPAPKKARKVMFSDPFIFHAVNAWLHPVEDPFNQQLLPLVNNAEWAAALAEACAVNHYRRRYQTFYIKAKGKVDIAYIENNRFWPVEIKWTQQLRPKQLSQIAKYPQGKILTKTGAEGTIGGIPTEPLPLALLRLAV